MVAQTQCPHCGDTITARVNGNDEAAAYAANEAVLEKLEDHIKKDCSECHA